MINNQIGIPNADRQPNDLYCTNPIVLEKLLEVEEFDKNIWECCNGLGHLSNVLIKKGYNVKKSDIINYKGDDTNIIDFLNCNDKYDGDIITNPPYRNAEDFIIKSHDLINDGRKIAMYLKINFLSSQKRYSLFQTYKPQTVYIMSTRYSCAKNGNFTNINGTMDYCWVIWVKGNTKDTLIKWIK